MVIYTFGLEAVSQSKFLARLGVLGFVLIPFFDVQRLFDIAKQSEDSDDQVKF